MKTSIIAACVASMSIAGDMNVLLSSYEDKEEALIEQEISSLEKQQLSSLASIELLSALLGQIDSMSSRLNNAEGRLNGTESRLTTAEGLVKSQKLDQNLLNTVHQEVDILNSKAIVKDYFYINKETISLRDGDCYPVMTVEKYQTFDFSANFSTTWDYNLR